VRALPSAYGLVLVTAIVLQPFVAFGEANRSQITQPARVVLYATITLALSLLVLVVVQQRASSGRDRAAVVVGAVAASFLHFSALFDSNPRDESKLAVVLLVWVLLTAGLGRVAHLVGANPNVRLALLLFVIALTALPAASLVAHAVEDDPAMALADPGPLATPAQRPNVYWIVLDAFARPDAMDELIGLDPSPFVASLERDDFEVSRTSFSSYWETHMSLASTLQMDYVRQATTEIIDEFDAFGPVVVGQNETLARFRRLGYHLAYGPAGFVEWSACREDLVDVCLPLVRPPRAVGELEESLLDLTPLGVLSLPTAYSTPRSFVDGLTEAGAQLERPFFAFQHVLSPHWPYRYRADCSARDVPVDDRRLTLEEQLDEYRTQVRCVAADTQEAVTRILEVDPSAIIIIQSDHGSRFHWPTPRSEWTTLQAQERFAAFNAMRLPQPCRDGVEGAPLVNTFRIVFACIEGRSPDLLEHRAFEHPNDDHGVYEEVDPVGAPR